MPHFWNDPSNLAPKQAHRWVIHFGEDRVFYYAKSVDRPSYSLNTVKGKLLYSHTVNFPGRLTWNPIKVTLYDVYSTDKDDTTQYDIHSKVTGSGYLDPSQTQLNAIFKQTLSTQVGTVKLIEMDRAGGIGDTDPADNLNAEKDTWTLNNPIISDVNYATLDYNNTEVLAITLTIAYDWAELTKFDFKSFSEKQTPRAKQEGKPAITINLPNAGTTTYDLNALRVFAQRQNIDIRGKNQQEIISLLNLK